jgi:hypothetical protein
LPVQVSRAEEKAMSTQLKMLQSELESGQQVWDPSGCPDVQGLVCASRTFGHGIVDVGVQNTVHVDGGPGPLDE